MGVEEVWLCLGMRWWLAGTRGWVGVGYATVCYGATLWCCRAIPYVDCDRLTSELGKICVGIISLIFVLGGKVLGPSAIGNTLGPYLLYGFGVAIIVVKTLTKSCQMQSVTMGKHGAQSVN